MFALIGASGYALNLAVFTVLVRSGYVPYPLAAVVAFLAATTSNYFGNRLWTFRGAERSVVGQGARFLAVSTVALGANLGVLHLLVSLGVASVAAQAVAVAAAVPFNYAGNKLWTFRVRRAAAAAEPVAPPAAVDEIRAMVCLPTYNERENLEPIVRALGAVLEPADRVLVIDDSSPDGTGAVADALSHELPFVEVLHRPRKEGLGRAYVDGFRYALARGAQLVLEMDSDFSHDPHDVRRLIAATERADVAIGSRYVRGGRAAGLPRLRRWLSRAGCFYARKLLGLGVRDLTGGFKCYRRAVLERIGLERVESSGYAFQIETTYRAARAGARVAEVPIDFRDRADGRSKMGAGIALEAVAAVPRLRLQALRDAACASGRVAAYVRIAAWYGASRLLVFGAALAVQAAGWPRRAWYPSTLEHPFALLGAWDGRWYRIVADRGYIVVPGHQSDPAFFPFFPLGVNLLRQLGLGWTPAGLLLANVGFLLGLVALYELARCWLPEPDARRTAIYAALFPFGFVFSMIYPEGLVFAGMALAGVFATRGRYVAAAIAGAAAMLGRPEAVFLVVPLGMLVARAWPSLSERARVAALTAVAAPVAALGGMALYQLRTLGDPLAFSHAQRDWGRWFSIDGIHRAAVELSRAQQIHDPWLYRDAAFLAVYLGCLWLAFRAGVPRAWVAAGVLMVLLPLESGSVTSIARFGLLALPVYAGLAWLGRRLWLDRTIRLVSPALLALGSATILHHWP